MTISAVYPGSFDPFTLGHLDIVERGFHLFDDLHILVAQNENKDHFLQPEQRERLARAPFPDSMTVELHDGLTDQYIRDHDIDVLLRGLRNGDDLRYEMELEEYFQKTADIEVVYLTPSSEHLKTSSTVVRRFLKTGHFEQAKEYLHETSIELFELWGYGS